MDKGITRGNCLLVGLNGLKEKDNSHEDPFAQVQVIFFTFHKDLFLPDEVFAERREGLLLVMTKHLKDNWLSLDVLHKRLSHLHCDLSEKRNNSNQAAADPRT